MNSSHWANDQARQRIADLRREAAGTELLRAARIDHAGDTVVNRRRHRLRDAVAGVARRIRVELAAISPASRGFRDG
jgi:hypothetical protein